MQTIIVDDKSAVVSMLQRILKRVDPAGSHTGYTEADNALQDAAHMRIDAAFIDIEMPGMDGITLAKKLRSVSENVFIVFLTGHIEYALEGYEVNALRYLTKPVDINKLKEVIRYVQEKQGGDRQIIIREEGEEILIDIGDVIYMEAMNQNVRIVTSKGEHVIRYNIGDFEEKLKNDGFFRIHRGYLISLSKVKKLVKNDVLMEDGTTLPVSRSNTKALKEALYSYVEGSAF